MTKEELYAALAPLEAACQRKYSEQFFGVLWGHVKDYHANPVKQVCESLAITEKKLPVLATILEQLPAQDESINPLGFINSEEYHFEEKLEKCLKIWNEHLSLPEQMAFWDGLSPRQRWFFAEAVKYRKTGTIFHSRPGHKKTETSPPVAPESSLLSEEALPF